MASGGYGSYGGSPYSADSSGTPSPYGAYGSYADLPTASEQPAQIVSVGIGDDYFQPNQVTVVVGTTVQWTNFGKHVHTVTWDGWGSGELRPRQVYSYTFNRAGSYAYHCAHHPNEMRGVVVVMPSGSSE